MGGDNGAGFHDGFDESEEVDEDELVQIVDQGREIACVVLAVAEVDDQEYALLAPAAQLGEDDDDEELELFIFRYIVTEDAVETFEGIEDDALWERVQQFFATLMDAEDADDEDDEDDA